ncbi:AraC family transcriptional regulator [Streptococcus cameli]
MFYSELHQDTMDLTIDFYGYEACSSLYSFGPAIRENYVLHYIEKGKGYFHYQNKVVTLQEGDLFLLKPNEVTFYQADEANPWAYFWIGLSGNKAKDYFSLSHIQEDAYLINTTQQVTGSIGQEIINLLQTAESKEHSTQNHLELLGHAYQILYLLSDLAPNKSKVELTQTEEICLECRHIIDKHYNLDGLSISNIADELSVNRSYLTTSFKKLYHISPKDYLLQTRMKRAKQLLEATDEAIKVISYSVGYRDPLYFSKAFKDFYKQSPSQFRRSGTILSE